MRTEETRTDQEEGAALGNKEEDPTPRDQGEAAQEDHTENTQEVKENRREVQENLQEDQGMRYTPVRTFFWKIRTRQKEESTTSSWLKPKMFVSSIRDVPSQ